MATSLGLMGAFISIFPAGNYASEPNKVILAIEIMMVFITFIIGLISFVKQMKSIKKEN
jgi:hypothetical protein